MHDSALISVVTQFAAALDRKGIAWCVLRNYENKGHKFVEIDALIVADGTTPIARVLHTAIYEPRQVRAA